MREEAQVDITAEEKSGFAVIRAAGRLDGTTAQQFEAAVREWIDSGHSKVVIDCSGLEYVSSAGLRAILMIAKAVKPAGGTLALASVAGTVREVMSLSGFDSFLSLYDTPEDAVQDAG
jgi:anti-anti-sigma factor